MRIAFIPFALMFALSACNRSPAPEAAAPEVDTAASASTPSDMPPAAEPAVDQTGSTAEGDGLALALLAAVNEHEIAAAQQAEGKRVSGPVMDYAKMMVTHHTENLDKTKALGELVMTDEVKAMQDKGAKDLADLGQKSRNDYEGAYVEAMVKGHTEALALIDTRLLTLASNGPVKDHLTATRATVAEHLDAAKKLQPAG